MLWTVLNKNIEIPNDFLLSTSWISTNLKRKNRSKIIRLSDLQSKSWKLKIWMRWGLSLLKLFSSKLLKWLLTLCSLQNSPRLTSRRSLTVSSRSSNQTLNMTMSSQKYMNSDSGILLKRIYSTCFLTMGGTTGLGGRVYTHCFTNYRCRGDMS